MLFYMVMEDEGPKHRYKKIEIDEKLFQRIAENDMDAFENLYSLTKQSVYSFALSIMKNHDEAMDILQETYLKVRGAAHLYQPMGKPMAWIFTITRNLSMSRLRITNRTQAPPEEMEDKLSFSYITDSTDKLVLQVALTILDMKEREIILLHAVAGFKHREIASNLGMSLGTVLSKYHRGINKLKKYLKDQGVQG